MENKYLPIGSVCTVKGQAKKIMITGYYSVEYNGNLKIKDYCGCFYPEGMLLPNSVMSFNHSEIDKIDFVGFKNDENEKFQANLNKLTGNATEEENVASSDQTYSKIVFDENGVVTLLEPVQAPVTEDVPAIETEEVGNPFYKEYDNEPAQEPKKSDLKFSRIKFDENGVVIGMEEITAEEKEAALNSIEPAPSAEPTPEAKPVEVEKTTLDTIQFDEDGNIVGV